MLSASGTQSECVFCQIAAGTAPARIVYETDDLLCFFPQQPELLGHTLIASKAHFTQVDTCPPEFGAALFSACGTLAAHYGRALGASGFNLLNASGQAANQSVQHLHFHYFPRSLADGLNTWPALPPFTVDLDDLHRRLRVAH